jgi:hypothetical protein
LHSFPFLLSLLLFPARSKRRFFALCYYNFVSRVCT